MSRRLISGTIEGILGLIGSLNLFRGPRHFTSRDETGRLCCYSGRLTMTGQLSVRDYILLRGRSKVLPLGREDNGMTFVNPFISFSGLSNG